LVFEAVGVGDLERVNTADTVFSSSGGFQAGAKSWDPLYHQGRWITANTLQISVPLGVDAGTAQARIGDEGMGLFLFVHPSCVSSGVGIMQVFSGTPHATPRVLFQDDMSVLDTSCWQCEDASKWSSENGHVCGAMGARVVARLGFELPDTFTLTVEAKLLESGVQERLGSDFIQLTVNYHDKENLLDFQVRQNEYNDAIISVVHAGQGTNNFFPRYDFDEQGWHTYTVVRSGAEMRCYVDDNLLGATQVSGLSGGTFGLAGHKRVCFRNVLLSALIAPDLSTTGRPLPQAKRSPY